MHVASLHYKSCNGFEVGQELSSSTPHIVFSPEKRIDDRGVIILVAHLAGASRMEDRLDVVPDETSPVVVAVVHLLPAVRVNSAGRFRSQSLVAVGAHKALSQPDGYQKAASSDEKTPFISY